ncbi:hypothetical protein HJG60_010801 [Phyllostomus discolor]|uniref:Uncharacterized protein n=1 Tax=Phyllostomus discolor TaxID=89673 RepID=A0A834AEI3_9CHIR|nr:hypothetical protein HJG60_010801 [Phyllostomus discolor]
MKAASQREQLLYSLCHRQGPQQGPHRRGPQQVLTEWPLDSLVERGGHQQQIVFEFGGPGSSTFLHLPSPQLVLPTVLCPVQSWPLKRLEAETSDRTGHAVRTRHPRTGASGSRTPGLFSSIPGDTCGFSVC